MTRFNLRPLFAVAIAGSLACSAFAAGDEWTEEFAQAKEQAESQNKDMLLNFTGSDWCGWCIKLDKEVFVYDKFTDYADENLVLVKLDYPRQKAQSEEIKQQNAKLKDTYAIRGYPTILLADATGRPYAQTGYQAGGPEAYVGHLKELQQVRITRDEHLDAASQATGAEKAKHLQQALDAVGEAIAVNHYEPQVREIIKLDADNKLGLKEQYTALLMKKQQEQGFNELVSFARANRDKPEQIVKTIDEYLATEGLQAQYQQQALWIKGQVQYFALDDKETAQETMLSAIQVQPESRLAAMIKQNMPKLFNSDS